MNIEREKSFLSLKAKKLICENGSSALVKEIQNKRFNLEDERDICTLGCQR